MKQAVCILISKGDKYVSISRRNDTSAWGIPGGKVDPGETNIEAAIREINEEIGLNLHPALMVPIYSGPCYGDVNYWVTTYFYQSDDVDLTDMEAEDGFVIQLREERDLCNPVISPFAIYNQSVFEFLEIQEKY